MTPRQVELHVDFGSPNAYLSHKVIPQIEQRTGAAFVYVPVLLGGVFKVTNNRSPIEAFGGVINKLAYEQRETERFIAWKKPYYRRGVRGGWLIPPGLHLPQSLTQFP